VSRIDTGIEKAPERFRRRPTGCKVATVVTPNDVDTADAGAKLAVSCASAAAQAQWISNSAFAASVTAVLRDEQGDGGYHVHYRTVLGNGTVDVAGSVPTVLASSNWTPLTMRRNRAIGATVILTLLALVVYGGHRGRDPWYLQHGHGWLVLALGLTTALMGGCAVAGLLLAASARNAARTWLPLGATLAMAIATYAAFAVDGPALSTARAALAAGNAEAARFEANAVLRLGRDKQGAKAILDEVHMRDVRGASDPARLAALVREPWFDAENRDAAVAKLVAVASDTVSKAYMDGSFAALAAIAPLIGDFDSALSERATGLAVLAHATQCARTRDFACAITQMKTGTPASVASEAGIVKANVISAMGSYIANQARESDARRDPYSRRDVLASAVAAAKAYQDFVGDPSVPPLDALESKLRAAQGEAAAADGHSAQQPASPQ
jgi:hypothetical protein